MAGYFFPCLISSAQFIGGKKVYFSVTFPGFLLEFDQPSVLRGGMGCLWQNGTPQHFIGFTTLYCNGWPSTGRALPCD